MLEITYIKLRKGTSQNESICRIVTHPSSPWQPCFYQPNPEWCSIRYAVPLCKKRFTSIPIFDQYQSEITDVFKKRHVVPFSTPGGLSGRKNDTPDFFAKQSKATKLLIWVRRTPFRVRRTFSADLLVSSEKVVYWGLASRQPCLSRSMSNSLFRQVVNQ